MNGPLKQSGNILRAIGCYCLLKLFQLVGFFLPSWGAWTKRLFFILTTYHELQRHQLFANLPLERVNTRLLKIKEHALLTNVSEITQWNIIHLDMDKIRKMGVDVDYIATGGHVTARDIEVISKAIIDSTPPSLNYGRSAMYTDVLRLLCQEDTCVRLA